MRCARCGKDTKVTIMSKFNTDEICMVCKDREERHPLYKVADAAEVAAVKMGNYNFQGIGKPEDL